MAKKENLGILKQGVEVWNEWRRENFNLAPDHSGADHSNAYLRGADLCDANLSRADLRGANLRSANLSDANLSGANFRHANLSRANLSDANLSRANLINASLSDANLRRAYLNGSLIGHTIFANCVLGEAEGLENCDHRGPSSLDHRTLLQSGPLPKAFLKGCGWADWQIETAKLYNPSLNPMEIAEINNEVYQLRQGPLQLANLFISYSHKDASFINALEKRFQAKGIRYWRDIHDASSGPLEKIVKNAITQMGTMLLVLSKHSVESDWVELEVERARKLEKEGKEHVLCPVALDNSWQSCGWPERLMNQVKKYNILDFSNWRNNQEKFDREYAKLLKGLHLFYSDPNTGADTQKVR